MCHVRAEVFCENITEVLYFTKGKFLDNVVMPYFRAQLSLHNKENLNYSNQ